MPEIIVHVSDVVAPVLLCVLVGFSLAKLELPFDNKIVGSLVSSVGYPTLIVSHLSGQHIALSAFLDMVLAATAVVACFGVIGFGLLTLTGLPTRAYLSPLMMNNVGNIGLPVSTLAFGHEGLAYAIAFVVVVLVGIFTVGMWLPMGKVSLSDVIRKPVIYAVLIAIVLMATETHLPTPINQTFAILGGLAIPLMLLTLGHTLATLQVGTLWRGCYLALLHLAMAVAVAAVLVRLFGLAGPARGVFVLMCVMPPSVATYLWVELYSPQQAPDVAGFILIATLLTVVTLPIVLTFWI